MIKVANLNISADNCGTYVITLTGVDATYFKVINKELYLLLDTPELCKLSYTVNVNITDLTGRLIKTRTYNLNTADCVCVASNPTFGTITRGVNGFTVQITNYKPAFTWTGTATASGVVSISGTGLVTVTGVPTGTTSTATITTTRIGYVGASAKTTGQALFIALTPTFGPSTRTANGFTVQITNYDGSYTWGGTPLISGSVVIDKSGLVTVSSIAPNTSSTVRITTTKTEHVGGTKDIVAFSLDVALNPTFGTTTRTTTGFTVQITNYNASYTWAGTATASGTVAVSSTGLVTVTNVAPGTSVTAKITATRSGYFEGSNEVTAISSYTPLFSTPAIETSDGFTVQITNYNPAFTWAGTATASGLVSISGTGLVTVSGIAANTNSTVTITITKASTFIGSASFTAKSLFDPHYATFDTPIRTSDGFTIQINNYNADFDWFGMAYGGDFGDLFIATINISGTGLVTVTGVAAGTEVTASISTTRAGYLRSGTAISAFSLNAALIPTFGTTTATADGFSVQISNYNSAYDWSGTATAGGVVVVSGTGLVTVTGLDVGENSVATIIATRTDYAEGRGLVAAYSTSFIPTFYDPISTANGFTVQIKNYNGFYTWNGAATTGSVSIAPGGFVTVTGVAAGTSVTVMITTTRTGYQGSSGSISATSLAAAWTPTFGATTATADGFTVQISNYNALYTWAGTATSSGSVAINGSGLVTVTGVAPGTSSTATITTTRTGYAGGAAPTINTYSLFAALVPEFGTKTPTADGFKVQITNYDSSYSWAGRVTAPATVVIGSTGLVTVTGAAAWAFLTVQITTTKSNTVDGVGYVVAVSLNTALTPLFNYTTTTSTATGFTVQISNYNAAYTWAGTATASGVVVVSGTGLVTVTGVAAGTSSTATITTTQAGYAGGSNTITATSLFTALVPTFVTKTPTADGFTVQISNYNSAYDWAGTATASGSVAISSTGLVTVTNVAANTSSTATITTTKANTGGGSAPVTATSLFAALTPTFGSTTATANGFTAQITNYNSGHTWSGTATASGSVFVNGTGLVVVTNVAPGLTSIATITTTRAGYAGGSATVEATSLKTGYTPVFDLPATRTANGFTVQIRNYDNTFTHSGTATALGTVSIDSSGFVTVSGVGAGMSSTATITTTQAGHVGGTANVTENALNAGIKPTFYSIARTADGFTAGILHYNSNDYYTTYSGTATAGGTVVIVGGMVTVTGVAADTLSVATITATKVGSTDGSATVTGISLVGALTPDFYAPTSTTNGFTVQIKNYDSNYRWSFAYSPLGKSISSSGLVTVTGLNVGQSGTVTINTERTNYASGSAPATGIARKAAFTPQLWTPVKTADGFTVQITNYYGVYYGVGTIGWAATVTSGSASIDSTGLVRVTGVAANTSSTVTVTTTVAGHVDGTASKSETSLAAALTPAFGTTTASDEGFTVQITNYNSAYTWAGTATLGSVAINSTTGVATVTGVAANTSSTATITTTRTGYTGGTADVAALSLPSYGLNFASLDNGAKIYAVIVGGNTGSYTNDTYIGPQAFDYRLNCDIGWPANGALCTGNNANTVARSVKIVQSGSTWWVGGTMRNANDPAHLVIDLGSIRTFNMARYYQMFSDGKTTHAALDISSNDSLQARTSELWTEVHTFNELDNSQTSTGKVVLFPTTTARYLRLRLYNDGRYGNPTYVELYNFKLFFTPT